MSEAVENYAKRYAEQVVETVRLSTLLVHCIIDI